MAQHATTWYFTMRQGPQPGRAYPLQGSTITIGRQAGNHIVIDDPMISRHHARLTWRGNTFLLEDLGSANGTWVNDVRITSPVLLRAGDVIGLSLEVLMGFSDRPPAGQPTYHAPAHPAAVPVAVPPPPPPPPAPSRAASGWLVFGVGGIVAAAALIVVGLAIYLVRGKPGPRVASSAFTPTPSEALSSAPYPTGTTTPTEPPTYTPYPTYTEVPTRPPTYTPYPTHTPYPTPAPTATPYPTYTPYPTPIPRPPTPQPSDTPVPTATTQPPYTVAIGGNVNYEPWGMPLDPDGCNGPYDDDRPVRRLTVEVILTNNSNRHIPDRWSPVFHTAQGLVPPGCSWHYDNTAVQPGETTNVTFFTHIALDDWVTAMGFHELNYDVTICLNGAGQVIPCQ